MKMITQEYATNELINLKNLKTPDWKVTHILRPDRLGLIESIRTFGVLQPIVTMMDGTIIDGSARWSVVHDLGEKDVLVKRVDCNKAQAMLLHIQMNRCRGNIIPYRLGRIIRALSATSSEQEVMAALNMSSDEFDILFDGSLIKKRKVKEHTYNKAWIPIESSSTEDFHIERPPTPDQ
jgi:ParB-like chromosome segregation protein Spo0J